jgi:DNA-binding CsgD family transcriptional regulator
MSFRDFTSASLQCQSQDQLVTLFHDELQREFGLEKFLYGLCLGSSTAHECPVFRNYPLDWTRHYISTNRRFDDPRFRLARTTDRILSWKEMRRRVAGSKKDINVLDEVHSVGLRNGLSVCFHAPFNTVHGLSFSTDASDHELSPSQTCELGAIANQFHLSYSALRASGPQLNVTLTSRQRDVLAWIAEGKSTSVIGDLLHITEFTVEDHLRKIFRKLECNNRTVAVLKAIRLGLIEIRS